MSHPTEILQRFIDALNSVLDGPDPTAAHAVQAVHAAALAEGDDPAASLLMPCMLGPGDRATLMLALVIAAERSGFIRPSAQNLLERLAVVYAVAEVADVAAQVEEACR